MPQFGRGLLACVNRADREELKLNTHKSQNTDEGMKQACIRAYCKEEIGDLGS